MLSGGRFRDHHRRIASRSLQGRLTALKRYRDAVADLLEDSLAGQPRACAAAGSISTVTVTWPKRCSATLAMRGPAHGGGQKATRLPPTRPFRWRRSTKPVCNGLTRRTPCWPRAACSCSTTVTRPVPTSARISRRAGTPCTRSSAYRRSQAMNDDAADLERFAFSVASRPSALSKAIARDECCARGRTDAVGASFRNGRSWRSPSVPPRPASSRTPVFQHARGSIGSRPKRGTSPSLDYLPSTLAGSGPSDRGAGPGLQMDHAECRRRQLHPWEIQRSAKTERRFGMHDNAQGNRALEGRRGRAHHL